MKKAYEQSGRLVRERLEKEEAVNAEVLDDLKKSDLVVVDGTYDHIHRVLEHLDMPHVRISRQELTGVTLRPEQTVFVNCASDFPPEGARRLATFVAEGGQL